MNMDNHSNNTQTTASKRKLCSRQQPFYTNETATTRAIMMPSRRISSASHSNAMEKVPYTTTATIIPLDDDDNGDDAKLGQQRSSFPLQSPAEYLQSLLGLRMPARKRTAVSDELMRGYDMVVIRAIRDNDVVQLKALVDSGRSLNACNRNGESLLHMACRRGSLQLIEFMLQHGGVDVTMTDDFGRTCLHDVCWRPTPHVDIMQLLLPYVPIEQLLQEDVRGHTPWEYCRKEHFAIWIQFLETHRDELLCRQQTHTLSHTDNHTDNSLAK